MYEEYYVKGKNSTDIVGFRTSVLFNRFHFDKEKYDRYLLEKKELEYQYLSDEKELEADDLDFCMQDLSFAHATENGKEKENAEEKDWDVAEIDTRVNHLCLEPGTWRQSPTVPKKKMKRSYVSWAPGRKKPPRWF